MWATRGRAMAKIAGEQIRVDVYKKDARTIHMKIVGGSNDPASVQRTQDYFSKPLRIWRRVRREIHPHGKCKIP